MNEREFAVLAASMQTYYPKEKLFPNKQSMELWYQALNDISADVAEAALKTWVTTNKWSPTIAELRQQALTVQAHDIPHWSDGWDECCRMMRKYGSYGAKQAMAELTGVTREAVRRLGFANLCRSENQMQDRANFRMIYEQLAERKHKELLISAGTQSQIEGIRQKGLSDESKRLLTAD